MSNYVNTFRVQLSCIPVVTSRHFSFTLNVMKSVKLIF